MNTLGEILKSARQSRRMTLSQLSEASGYSEGMLSMLENNQATPSMSRLISLMNTLNMSKSQKQAALEACGYPVMA
jgi:transcriptional regulator with XRE-family HTH domain